MITTRKTVTPEQEISKAEILIEALPYMQSYHDKTILIKFGGSAMDNPDLVVSLMRDIVVLKAMGMNIVVVHGGGKAISQAMAAAGLEARFVNGLRVTTPEAIGIVEKTLSDEINPDLVSMIRRHGGSAVGIPGTSVFVGEKLRERDAEGNRVDIGMVGRVIGCQLQRVEEALSLHLIPVISPLARELGTSQPLNVNADLAAAALARELKPVKLIYISDVPGLLLNPEDKTEIIESINRKEAFELIEQGVISGGMIPKVTSAVDALNAGVRKVHFIDGRLPHTLLLEIFTPEGIGTEIVREQR